MLRCSPEAFSKCPTRHICGKIEDATFTDGSECDLFNRSVVSKPMTNGDRIRAMSDEELADMLVFFQNVRDGYQCPDGNIERTYSEAIAYTVELLKQPAEEEL